MWFPTPKGAQTANREAEYQVKDLLLKEQKKIFSLEKR